MCVYVTLIQHHEEKRDRKCFNKLEEECSYNGVTNLEVKVYNVLLMKMTETFEDLTQEHHSCCLVHLLTTSEVLKQLAARHAGNISCIISVISVSVSSQGRLQTEERRQTASVLCQWGNFTTATEGGGEYS